MNYKVKTRRPRQRIYDKEDKIPMHITLYIRESLRKKFLAYCNAEGLPRSTVIEKAIEQYLNDI